MQFRQLDLHQIFLVGQDQMLAVLNHGSGFHRQPVQKGSVWCFQVTNKESSVCVVDIAVFSAYCPVLEDLLPIPFPPQGFRLSASG